MNQKTIATIIVSSLVILTGAGLYLYSRNNRKAGVPVLNKIADVFNPLTPISDDFIKSGLGKSNALLQQKRNFYEAKWKASKSKLSFKDWYIENAE